MVIFLALIGVLVIGLLLGLLWQGSVVIGDRRTLDRLASQLVAEQRMQAQTHATLRAMRETARDSWQGGGAR